MRVKLLFGVAAIFMLTGTLIDCSYQRSTPDAVFVQGTVVGFDRPHAKQVYPIFEFSDPDGRVHRVVNSFPLRPRDSIHNGRGLTRFGSTIVG
jgi:hypothetical protein